MRVSHQVALRDLALSLDVRRARLEADDVGLLELELGRVLDRYHPFRERHEAGHDVEQGRLAGAGAARNDDVQATVHDGLQHHGHRLVDRAEPDQVVGLQELDGKPANRHHRPVQRERRDDHVDARSVPKAGVHHRR
jgi:hypothetical protein